MAPIEKLLKVIDSLKSGLDDKKKKGIIKHDKIKYLNLATDLICHHIDKLNPNFLSLLGSTCEVLMLYFNDEISDVRMKAEECFTIITKALTDQTNRIQVELYKEIKRNGQSRTLKACLLRFALLVKHIRRPKFRAYITHLYPTIGDIAQRDEESIQETLYEFVKLVNPVLGRYATTAETRQLLDAFGNSFLNLQTNASVRFCCDSMAAIVQHSRYPLNHFEYLAKRYLATGFAHSSPAHQVSSGADKSVWSVLLAIKHLLKVYPTISESGTQAIFGRHVDKSSTNLRDRSILTSQIFQAIIDHVTCHVDSRDQNVANLAIDSLTTIFSTVIKDDHLLTSEDSLASSLWKYFTNSRGALQNPKGIPAWLGDVRPLPTVPSNSEMCSENAERSTTSFVPSITGNAPELDTPVIVVAAISELFDTLVITVPAGASNTEIDTAGTPDLDAYALDESSSLLTYATLDPSLEEVPDTEEPSLSHVPSQPYLEIKEGSLTPDQTSLAELIPEEPVPDILHQKFYYDLCDVEDLVESKDDPNLATQQIGESTNLLDTLVKNILVRFLIMYRQIDPSSPEVGPCLRKLSHHSSEFGKDCQKSSSTTTYHLRMSVQTAAMTLLNSIIRLNPSYILSVGTFLLVPCLNGVPQTTVAESSSAINRHVAIIDLLSIPDIRDPNLGCQVAALLVSVLQLAITSPTLLKLPIVSSDREATADSLSFPDLVLKLRCALAGEEIYNSSPILQSYALTLSRSLLSHSSSFTWIDRTWIDFMVGLDEIIVASYWLSKVNYITMLQSLDYLELAYWEAFVLQPEMKYEKKLTDRLVDKLFTFLGDSDSRVRTSAANTITELVPKLVSDLPYLNSLTDYARIRASFQKRSSYGLNTDDQNLSSMNRFHFMDPTIPMIHSLKYPYTTLDELCHRGDLAKDPLTIVADKIKTLNLSRVIHRTMNRLSGNGSKSEVMGCTELLSLLAHKYPPLRYPLPWNVLVRPETPRGRTDMHHPSFATDAPPLTLSRSTFYAHPSPDSNAFGFTNHHSILAFFFSYLDNDPSLNENLTLHGHLLGLVTHIFISHAYHNGKSIPYTLQHPNAQHWPGISDRDLISTMDSFFTHLLRTLAICCRVIEGKQQQQQQRTHPIPNKQHSNPDPSVTTLQPVTEIDFAPVPIGSVKTVDKRSAAVPNRFNLAGMMNDLFAPVSTDSSSAGNKSSKDLKDTSSIIPNQSTSTSSLGERLGLSKKKSSTVTGPESIVAGCDDGSPHAQVSNVAAESSPLNVEDTKGQSGIRTSGRDPSAADYPSPDGVKTIEGGPLPPNFTLYDHLPLYQSLYDVIKRTYHTYTISLRGGENQKFFLFLNIVLDSLQNILELASCYESSKILDQVLQCLTICLPLSPTATIGCMTQLLKSLFGTNLLYYPKQTSTGDDGGNKILQVADIQIPQSPDNQENLSFFQILSSTKTGMNIYPDFDYNRGGNDDCQRSLLDMRRRYLGWKFNQDLSDSNSNVADCPNTDKSLISAYIQKFESLVIHSLKLYTTTSRTDVQSKVLNMLIQLILLRINYRLLDSDQIFINFLLKQIEYVEQGYYDDCSDLIYSLFQFFSLLTRENIHSNSVIITIPKLINLAELIIASEKPVDSLVFPAYFVLVQELYLTVDDSNPNKSSADFDKDTMREVVSVVLCRYLEQSNVQVLLTIILRVLRYEVAETDPVYRTKWFQLSQRVVSNLRNKILVKATNDGHLAFKPYQYNPILTIDSPRSLEIFLELLASLPPPDQFPEYSNLLGDVMSFAPPDPMDLVANVSALKYSAFTTVIPHIHKCHGTDVESRSIVDNGLDGEEFTSCTEGEGVIPRTNVIDIKMFTSELISTLFNSLTAYVKCKRASPPLPLITQVDKGGNEGPYSLDLMLQHILELYVELCTTIFTEDSHSQIASLLSQRATDADFKNLITSASDMLETGQIFGRRNFFLALKFSRLLRYLRPRYDRVLEISPKPNDFLGFCYSLNATLSRFGEILLLLTPMDEKLGSTRTRTTITVDDYDMMVFNLSEPIIKLYFQTLPTSQPLALSFLNSLDNHNMPLWDSIQKSEINLVCPVLWSKAYEILTSPSFHDDTELMPIVTSILIRHYFWLTHNTYARALARKYVGRRLADMSRLISLELSAGARELTDRLIAPHFPLTLLLNLYRQCDNAIPFTKSRYPMKEILKLIKALYPQAQSDFDSLGKNATDPHSGINSPLGDQTDGDNKETIASIFRNKIQNYPRSSSPWFGQMCINMDIEDLASLLTITDVTLPHLTVLYRALKQHLYRKIVTTLQTDYSKEATTFLILTTKLYAIYEQKRHMGGEKETTISGRGSVTFDPSEYLLCTLTCLKVLNMHPSMCRILPVEGDWMDMFVQLAESALTCQVRQVFDPIVIDYLTEILLYDSKRAPKRIPDSMVEDMIRFLSTCLAGHSPLLASNKISSSLKAHVDRIMIWFDKYTDHGYVPVTRNSEQLYRLTYNLFRIPELNKYVLLNQPLGTSSSGKGEMSGSLANDHNLIPQPGNDYCHDRLSSLSCESSPPHFYYADLDIFYTLCNRSLMLGWADKHIFQELWIVLAATLNYFNETLACHRTERSVSLETKLERIHVIRLAAQTSSVLFLYTTLAPYPGNPLYSQLPGTNQSCFKNIDIISRYGPNLARLHKYFSLDTSSCNWNSECPSWPLRDTLYPSMNLAQVSLRYTWSVMGLKVARVSTVEYESNDTVLVSSGNPNPPIPSLYAHSGYDLASCFALATDLYGAAMYRIADILGRPNADHLASAIFFEGGDGEIGIQGAKTADKDESPGIGTAQGFGGERGEGVPYRKLLLELVKSVIYISDLFCTLPHFQWMQKVFCHLYDTFEDESDFGNCEDELLMSYLTLGLAKSSAALAMPVTLCDSLKKVVENVLKQSHVSSKMVGFKASLYLCEANPYASEALINYVADHGLALFQHLTPSTLVSGSYVKVLVQTLFYLAETFQNVPVSKSPSYGPDIGAKNFVGAIFGGGIGPKKANAVGDDECDSFVQRLVDLVLARFILHHNVPSPPSRKISGKQGIGEGNEAVVQASCKKLSYQNFMLHSTRSSLIPLVMHLERLILLNIIPAGSTFDAITYAALSGFKAVSASQPPVLLQASHASFSTLRLLLTSLYVGRDCRLKRTQQYPRGESHHTEPATALVLEALETVTASENPESIFVRSRHNSELFVSRPAPNFLPAFLLSFSFASHVMDKLLALCSSPVPYQGLRRFDDGIEQTTIRFVNPFFSILNDAFYALLNTDGDDANASAERLEHSAVSAKDSAVGTKVIGSNCKRLKWGHDWALLGAEKLVASRLKTLSLGSSNGASFGHFSDLPLLLWPLSCMLVAASPSPREDSTSLLAYLSFRDASLSHLATSDVLLLELSILQFYTSLDDLSYKQRFRDFLANSLRSLQVFGIDSSSRNDDFDNELMEVKCLQRIYTFIANGIDPLRDG